MIYAMNYNEIESFIELELKTKTKATAVNQIFKRNQWMYSINLNNILIIKDSIKFISSCLTSFMMGILL